MIKQNCWRQTRHNIISTVCEVLHSRIGKGGYVPPIIWTPSLQLTHPETEVTSPFLVVFASARQCWDQHAPVRSLPVPPSSQPAHPSEVTHPTEVTPSLKWPFRSTPPAQTPVCTSTIITNGLFRRRKTPSKVDCLCSTLTTQCRILQIMQKIKLRWEIPVAATCSGFFV